MSVRYKQKGEQLMKENVRENWPALLTGCLVILSAALLWLCDVIFLMPLQSLTYTMHLLTAIDVLAGRPLLWLNAGIVLCILLPFSQLEERTRKSLLAAGIVAAVILFLLELSIFIPLDLSLHTPLSVYHLFTKAPAQIAKHSAVFCVPGVLIGIGIVKNSSV